MKGIVIGLIALVIASGCASVHVACDGWEVSYCRVGDQELSDLSIKVDGDKIEVALGKQKATAEVLAEACKAIASGVTTSLLGFLSGGSTLATN